MTNRIIFASKFYYKRGGLESYMFRLQQLLSEKEYEIIPFSTGYNLNYKTQYDEFFCKYNDLSDIKLRQFGKNMQAFFNMFFNFDAYKKMNQLCRQIRPEIVQGFGVAKHLSASIFKAAKENGAKTVFRLSDFALMCPGSIALDGNKNPCLSFNCYNNWDGSCIKKKCIKDSNIASMIGFIETKGNKLLDLYNKYVDHWIAPSKFLRDQFIRNYGIPEKKISYLPVFFDSSLINPVYDKDDGFVLYAGRLSREKGIGTLLKAFNNTGIPLVIAGGGGEYEDTIKNIKSDSIKYVGFKSFEDLKGILQRCRFLVLPSECLENSPNIVLEAQAAGKPVIASDIGGIPEMVENGATGLIFESGNPEALISAVNSLYYNKRHCAEMGRIARARIENDYTVEKHYTAVSEIYSGVLNNSLNRF